MNAPTHNYISLKELACQCLAVMLLMLTTRLVHAHQLAVIEEGFVSQWKAAQTIPQSQVKKHFEQPIRIPPADFKRVYVANSNELMSAVKHANKSAGKTAIYLDNGRYNLSKTLLIQADHIWLVSSRADPYSVVLKGLGMRPTAAVHNIITVAADHFVLDGITLTDSPNHLIQIAAERGASYPIIRNSILQNSYEQLIKVSYNQHKRPDRLSVGGLVEHSIFQYTAGIAPHYYTGGIDALGAVDWTVQHNVFRDIASPQKRIAQHAVHFWVNSANNNVIDNLFVDNDRAVGFGMVQSKRNTETLKYSNQGGLIEGNVIFHGNNGDRFGDTGIVLEASAETVVANNTIFMQHRYPRAIEYRFAQTQNVLITGNATNKAIASRNGGKAKLANNKAKLKLDEFIEQLNDMLAVLGVDDLYQPLQIIR